MKQFKDMTLWEIGKWIEAEHGAESMSADKFRTALEESEVFLTYGGEIIEWEDELALSKDLLKQFRSWWIWESRKHTALLSVVGQHPDKEAILDKMDETLREMDAANE